MILYKEYLKAEAKKIPIEKKMLFESEKFNYKQNYDIFLSHSFSDKDIVNALYVKFSECGYNVFIDWKEEELKDRSKVSKKVANKLKTYMNSSKGLLYVATSNSVDSKWCPWELGYVDGKKDRVAILPILESKPNNTIYTGQEYLGIYPYVTYSISNKSGKYNFWVYDVDNQNNYCTLKYWLENGELINHNNK